MEFQLFYMDPKSFLEVLSTKKKHLFIHVGVFALKFLIFLALTHIGTSFPQLKQASRCGHGHLSQGCATLCDASGVQGSLCTSPGLGSPNGRLNRHWASTQKHPQKMWENCLGRILYMIVASKIIKINF